MNGRGASRYGDRSAATTSASRVRLWKLARASPSKISASVHSRRVRSAIVAQAITGTATSVTPAARVRLGPRRKSAAPQVDAATKPARPTSAPSTSQGGPPWLVAPPATDAASTSVHTPPIASCAMPPTPPSTLRLRASSRPTTSVSTPATVTK